MAENNKNSNAVNGTVNLVDLFRYLISCWPWFILGLVVFLGYQIYNYSTADLIYQSKATVIIKTQSERASGEINDKYGSPVNKTNVRNEMLEFQSRDLMTEVVSELGADVSYRTRSRFRMSELYTNTPVRARFLESPSSGTATFTVIPAENGVFSVTASGSPELKVSSGDTVILGGARVVLEATPFYTHRSVGNPIEISKSNPGDVAGSFISRLSIVQSQDEASILTLTLKDYSPRRAADVLDALVDIYNRNAIQYKKEVAANTTALIDERLSDIEIELNSVDSDIQLLQTQNNVMDLGQAASLYQEQNSRNAEKVRDIDSKIRFAENLKAYITQDTDYDNLIISSYGMEGTGVDVLIEKYNDEKLRRDRLLENSTPHNPVIQSMDKDLAAIKTNIVFALENYVDNQQIAKKGIETTIRDQRNIYSSLPAAARKIVGTERNQSTMEEQYLYLLNEREKAAITMLMVDSNARVIDKASFSWEHVSPNRNSSILIGILAGLLVPAVILLLLYFFDTKVRRRRDVEEISDMPFLAEIPDLKRGMLYNGAGKCRVCYGIAGNGRFTESMRTLLTSLDFFTGDDKSSRVVAVTSLYRRDGKSFTTLNLAACCADGRKKTIMLDMDFRRHMLTRAYGLLDRPGLTEYLDNPAMPVSEIINRNSLDDWSFDFVPAGAVPSNPVEFLQRGRLDELILMLKKMYDYVLIDTPPMEEVADAMVMNRFADCTLMIIKAGRIDKTFFEELDLKNKTNRLHNLCVVLNKTEARCFHMVNYEDYGAQIEDRSARGRGGSGRTRKASVTRKSDSGDGLSLF